MAKRRRKVGLDREDMANREILFDILAREGVENVTVLFEGSGDSGSLEDSDLPLNVKNIVVKGCRISQGTVWNGDGPTKRWKENCTVEDVLKSLCYEVLSSEHGGWENNDGAWGEFTFNVKERTAHLDFNQRYTESDLYEHQF